VSVAGVNIMLSCVTCGYIAFCNDVCRSADFNDFLSKCLLKDPSQRLAAADLLQVSVSVSYCSTM